MKAKFEYAVIYNNVYFIESFNNLEKAIRFIKRTVKHNPDNKGGYDIRLDNITIWNY